MGMGSCTVGLLLLLLHGRPVAMIVVVVVVVGMVGLLLMTRSFPNKESTRATQGHEHHKDSHEEIGEADERKGNTRQLLMNML